MTIEIEIKPKLNAENEAWYEPTPEDFLPSPKKPLARIYKIPKFKNAFFAVLFLAISFVISYQHWRFAGSDLSVSYHSFFQDHQYWRSLSALFVHSDIAHYLNNGWLLFLFGWFLTDFAGKLAFPWISILLGIITNILTILTMPPETRLVGASGMVYAMVAFWIVLYVRYTPLSLKSKVIRAIGFILVLLFPTTYVPTTSYEAHGIGFGLGLISGFIYILFSSKNKEFEPETIS